ncbi:MAG: carboxypeptidase-like regulatory domain-containing protein, partial [Planctomycetales bacterium]
EADVPPDLALGAHVLLVKATDKVGIETKIVPVTLSIRNDPPPAPKMNRITGTVVFRREPAAGIQVTVTDQDASAVTDEKGRFSIKLPPGQYEVVAEGVVANNNRKGAVAVELEAPPAPAVKITLPLEFQP